MSAATARNNPMPMGTAMALPYSRKAWIAWRQLPVAPQTYSGTSATKHAHASTV